MPEVQPKFTLIGAGPGDPDLITVKGVKALASADVVLYDALIDKALLDYSPKAKKVFVGKRKGFKAYSQEEINELIVKHALKDGHVVRLKGGDPFVFGRGAEEIAYAENFGIEISFIPGITSSISVPANLGIAVTQRHVAQSFWVLTGTSSERTLSHDIAVAAQTSATLVILMGMSKLSQIVDIFNKQGKEKLPVAIIQDGTTDREKVGVGTIKNILSIVEEKKLSNPAIIVIGEVVRHSHKLSAIFDEMTMDNTYDPLGQLKIA